MADAAIQMIRGGMSGFLAWDLDDSMHFYGDGGESMNALSDVLPDNAYEKRKVWGFWNIVGAEHGDPEGAFTCISKGLPNAGGRRCRHLSAQGRRGKNSSR
jgi:hypothetical protein